MTGENLPENTPAAVTPEPPHRPQNVPGVVMAQTEPIDLPPPPPKVMLLFINPGGEPARWAETASTPIAGIISELAEQVPTANQPLVEPEDVLGVFKCNSLMIGQDRYQLPKETALALLALLPRVSPTLKQDLVKHVTDSTMCWALVSY